MKKVFIMFLTAVTVTCSSLTAFAAPETMPDGTIFDAEYYAQAYPDVTAAIGTGRDALYNHYVTFGKAEGRYACAPDTAQSAVNPAENPISVQKNIIGTTPIEALVYINYLPDFLLTDSRPTSLVDNARGIVGSEYEYDDYGNIISHKTAMNDSYSYIRDAEGRIIMINYKSPNVSALLSLDHIDISLSYDEQGRLVKIEDRWKGNQDFWYDEQGFLIKTTDSSGDIKYTFFYDEHGRLQYRYTKGDKDYETEYSYDEHGKLIKVKYFEYPWNQGRYSMFVYDASGKIVSVESYNRFYGAKDFGSPTSSNYYYD